jgi:hypothetical protein
MELSPSRPNRLANCALGALPAAGCVAYAAQAGDGVTRFAACALAAASVVLAVRGYRLGVTCAQGRLTIRGYLRTRVIPLGSVTAITGFPAVRWVTPSGRGRWTPVTAFMPGPGEIPAVRARKRLMLARLRRWAGR